MVSHEPSSSSLTIYQPPGPPAVLYVARRRRRRPNRSRIALLSGLVATGLLALSSTTVAFQDVASLFGRDVPLSQRWLARLVPTPAGASYVPTLVTPEAHPVFAMRTDVTVEPTLDLVRKGLVSAPDFIPPRVNRDDKRDAAMSRPRPIAPSRFSAGVLQHDVLGMVFGAPAASEAVAMLMPTDAAKMAVAAVVPPKPVAAPVAVLASIAGETRAPHPGKTADDLAVQAYANPDDTAAIEAPFNAVLAKPMAIGKDGKPDHWWVTNPIPLNARSKTEQKCLATAIYFEARGEPVKGELAVAQVVINRLKNPAYPNTICGVVYQNKDMRDACQFSFACDGIKDRITDMSSWRRAQELARRVVTQDNWWNADVGSATHYHANYVKPRWARTMKKMERIGHHIFYKTFGGGWS
ncbi:cell wall hydrolase [Mesorhizobium sp. BR1-1-16]|uniref:cell wall hydrolase n=1 Tax=Mesorhizobium sp. BR1-1-16 TaxID=2876653 RepID=UPI001CCEA1A8|nr:cell wall hydrolase [Mesorhizobium sp. BR1-1-16]MBZ9934851.1 cell wall hydrolase [Mesorhizobium sp. BR1-1-16]